MAHYWITFDDDTTGCRHGESEQDAMDSAEKITGKKPSKAERLPYPATPRILAREEWFDAAPSICMDGNRCAGHSACPYRISCAE